MSLYFLPSAFFLPLPLFKLIKFFFYPRFSFLLILKVACRVDVCPSEKYLMDISEIFKNSDHHSPFWSLTESTSIFFFFTFTLNSKPITFFPLVIIIYKLPHVLTREVLSFQAWIFIGWFIIPKFLTLGSILLQFLLKTAFTRSAFQLMVYTNWPLDIGRVLCYTMR